MQLSLRDRRLFSPANNQAVRCSENGIKGEGEQLSSSGEGLDCPTDRGRVPGQFSAVLKGLVVALQTSLLHNTSFRTHSCQILMYPHANSPELVSARRKSCGINMNMLLDPLTWLNNQNYSELSQHRENGFQLWIIFSTFLLILLPYYAMCFYSVYFLKPQGKKCKTNAHREMAQCGTAESTLHLSLSFVLMKGIITAVRCSHPCKPSF